MTMPDELTPVNQMLWDSFAAMPLPPGPDPRGRRIRSLAELRELLLNDQRVTLLDVEES